MAENNLYNALFDPNPYANALLTMLKTSVDAVPRFRDCYLNPERRIVIFTRTGGGNRAAYADANVSLTLLPGYVGDCDDAFDTTYAYFIYQPEAEFSDLIAEIADKQGVIDPLGAFRSLIADVEAGKDTPATRRAMDVGRGIVKQIESGITIVRADARSD